MQLATVKPRRVSLASNITDGSASYFQLDRSEMELRFRIMHRSTSGKNQKQTR